MLVDGVYPRLDERQKFRPAILDEEGAMVVVDVGITFCEHLDNEAIVGIARDDERLVGLLGGLDVNEVRLGLDSRKVQTCGRF